MVYARLTYKTIGLIICVFVQVYAKIGTCLITPIEVLHKHPIAKCWTWLFKHNQKIDQTKHHCLIQSRAMARALIGGGGVHIFIYSCYARLISFDINPNDN